ncbi:MAG: hypothetical protein ABIW76_21160, partial [Fibrobacteria bacterium]
MRLYSVGAEGREIAGAEQFLDALDDGCGLPFSFACRIPADDRGERNASPAISMGQADFIGALRRPADCTA